MSNKYSTTMPGVIEVPDEQQPETVVTKEPVVEPPKPDNTVPLAEAIAMESKAEEVEITSPLQTAHEKESPVQDTYEDLEEPIIDATQKKPQPLYDANADHYYDDVLPEIIEQLEKVPTDRTIRLICIIAFAIAIVVTMFFLI